MNPPDREEQQVPSTASREGELEPGHPTRSWSGGRNDSIPTSQGGWQPGREGGGSPFTPIPASTQRLGPHATYSHFEKEVSCLCGDLSRSHTGEGPAGRGDQQAGGDIGRGKRGAQIPAPSAQSWRGPRGVRAAPALQPRIAVPAKTPPLAPWDRIWESANQRRPAGWPRPIARRHGPGPPPLGVLALPAARFALTRPIVTASAPSPFRVPGNLGPGSQFLPGTWARAAAGKPRWGRRGGGGRRRGALLLCIKGPLLSPRLAALGDRGHSQGRGKQMEFGKTIYTLWTLPPPPPPRSNLRGS